MTQKSTKKTVRISEITIPEHRKIFNDRAHKHIIITSGRAGAKSSFAGIRGIYQLAADPNGSVVALRKHHNKLRKTIYKEMIRAIGRLGMRKPSFGITKSPMEIQYKKTGTTMYFTGSDSIDDTKGIIDEDRPIKLVILDELTEFFDSGEGEEELANIEATFVRGNGTGSFQMLYLYNPPKNPNAPINQWCRKMEKRRDCIHIHTDYRDVPVAWLGKGLIESAEIMRETDEKMYDWIWLGLQTGVDDLIYYMFSAEKHVWHSEEWDLEERRRVGEIVIGVDYGQKNATVFEAFGVDWEDQKLRGLAEYYHSGRDSGRQRSPSEYAQHMKEFCENIEKIYNRIPSAICIDPSAAGLIEEVRRVVPHVPVKLAENDVKLGISRVQKLLSFGVLSLSEEQTELVREMGVYQYDPDSIEKGKEEPIKKDDHCEDATRYAVCGIWRLVKLMLPTAEREGRNEDS